MEEADEKRSGLRSIGEYQLIGPHVKQATTPDILILDTNVLIDIEDYYFKGIKPARIGALLREFPNVGLQATDINYGWAVAEITQRRGEPVDFHARRRLTHAAKSVIEWNLDQVEHNLSNRHAPVNRDKRWPKKAIDKTDAVGDPRVAVLPHYGALLFLMKLNSERRSWRGRDPLWPLEQYVAWVDDTFGIRSSYCLHLAVSLLVGSAEAKSDATRIFKLSGSEGPEELAQKSWNVAWDITMLASVEGMTYGLFPDRKIKSANLVTRDADPVLLRIASEVRVMIESDQSRVPMSLIGYESNRKVSRERLDALLQFDPVESMRRLSRNPDEVVSQAATAVSSLEQELGLERHFSFDGWPR